MSKVILLNLCAVYNLAFAVFHISFWKMFKWNEDLKKISVTNRVIIQILNTRLIYIFFLIAFIYFFYPEQLLDTKIGLVLLVGILFFWIGRTIEQFVFLRDKSTRWIILTIIFIFGSIIHLLPIVIK